jgi:hypothetical protein
MAFNATLGVTGLWAIIAAGVLIVSVSSLFRPYPTPPNEMRASENDPLSN